MVLAKALYSESNELLLSRGYALNENLIERIRRLGFYPIYIEEGGTEEIVVEDLVNEKVLWTANESARKVFDSIASTVKHQAGKDLDEIVKHMRAPAFSLPLADVKKAVTALVEDLLDSVASEWTMLPSKFITGSHFRHGVDVAILSLLIGLHFRYNHQELKHLGLAAVLHDLGMTVLPNLQEKKNCDFTEEDWVQYRRHPQYGVSLFEGQQEGLYVVRESIYQHHERPDGKGFPNGLIGSQLPPNQRSKPAVNEIFRMAEIIHVANAYVNLTTGGWTKAAFSPEEAITEMIRELPGAYNPHIVSALSQIVVRFPKGAMVRVLRTGSQRFVGFRGAVAVPNQREPHKPILILIENRFGQKIKPLRVDFGAEKVMQIKLDI
jgi:hypothetical protein